MKPRDSKTETGLSFLLFTVYCILATAIVGCAKSDIPAENKNTPKQVVMWLIGSEDQAITIRDLANDFYKKTGISVRCDAISWGDAHSKYLTSIAGGVAPDIGTMGLTWSAEFGRLQSMVDLKKAYPVEIESIKDSVFKGLWDSLECKGAVYGIPFDMTEYVFYYRSDIISSPPKTWDELTALLAELVKKNKGMIFEWGSLTWIGYSPFLWQAGGDYYNKEYTASTVDSPEAVRAMGFFADLYRLYNVPKTKIPLEQGIRTGDFPIAISGNWKIDSLRILAPEVSGKWAISMLPAGPTGRRTTFIGGRVMGIFEQSRNKEAAWSFIKYLVTPETQTRLYEAALTKQDTYLPPVKKTWEMLKMDKEFKDILFNQANEAKGPPALAEWDSAAKYMDNAIQRVILRGADARAELGRARVELERMLKN